MAQLILVRHGVTDWNKKGRWHGWSDIPLNEEGKKQAREAAKKIKPKINIAFASKLQRTQQTLTEICSELGLSCDVIYHEALNERNYGIFTGKSKWEIQKELGEKDFLKIRRSWNHPIPQGETLKDVYERVVPFYREKILVHLKEGKNVLVVSSGNTLRALIKYLENISNKEIVNLELDFAGVYTYQINEK